MAVLDAPDLQSGTDSISRLVSIDYERLVLESDSDVAQDDQRPDSKLTKRMIASSGYRWHKTALTRPLPNQGIYNVLTRAFEVYWGFTCQMYV